MNRHHLNVRPNKCQFCGKGFYAKYHLSKHVKNVHSNEEYVCDYNDCNFKTKYLKSFNEHQRRHRSIKVFKCLYPSCGKSYHMKTVLDKHMKIIHSNAEDIKQYVCDEKDCNFKSKYWPNFLRHQRRHKSNKSFECLYPSCGKRFHFNYDLKDHMKSHSDVRNYPCEWPGCDMRFKSSHMLKRHKCVHLSGCDPTLPCVWPGCESMFKTKVNLFQHIRNVHKNVRNFVCDWPECGKRFPGSDILSQHMNTHKGLKPYLCPISGCGHRYAAKTNLKKHIQTAHKN